MIRCKKTRGGFGGVFGTWLGKHPYYFAMPTPEREGGGGQQEGWIFTEPMDKELPALPEPGMTEAASGIRWLPERNWSKAEAGRGQLERIFGRTPGATAVAWTSAFFPQRGKGSYFIQGSSLSIGSVKIHPSCCPPPPSRSGVGIANSTDACPATCQIRRRIPPWSSCSGSQNDSTPPPTAD